MGRQRPACHLFPWNDRACFEKAGMVNQKIYFDASKILKIKNKHPEITDRVIKQIPSVLQNPIIIMKSKDPKNKPR